MLLFFGWVSTFGQELVHESITNQPVKTSLTTGYYTMSPFRSSAVYIDSAANKVIFISGKDTVINEYSVGLENITLFSQFEKTIIRYSGKGLKIKNNRIKIEKVDVAIKSDLTLDLLSKNGKKIAYYNPAKNWKDKNGKDVRLLNVTDVGDAIEFGLADTGTYTKSDTFSFVPSGDSVLIVFQQVWEANPETVYEYFGEVDIGSFGAGSGIRGHLCFINLPFKLDSVALADFGGTISTIDKAVAYLYYKSEVGTVNLHARGVDSAIVRGGLDWNKSPGRSIFTGTADSIYTEYWSEDTLTAATSPNYGLWDSLEYTSMFAEQYRRYSTDGRTVNGMLIMELTAAAEDQAERINYFNFRTAGANQVRTTISFTVAAAASADPKGIILLYDSKHILKPRILYNP